MSKPIVLVTGQNGQLGNELRVLSANYPQYDFVFTGIAELDITDDKKVDEFFNQCKPIICINAAAYTAVDKAETERESALKINARAVGNLAANCARINTRFIHISTDYVFDGTASAPYKEDNAVSPVNFYGESKLKGEEIALNKNPCTVIIRTSWVYSVYGNNFVKTMLRLMNQRESINVVSDQFGSPTYAADLAAAILHIASQTEQKGGIFHFSNKGAITWFDFAVAIKDLTGLSCTINPVATSGYPTPAKRPAYSVMCKEKIESAFGIQLKDWRDSLQECLQLLQQ